MDNQNNPQIIQPMEMVSLSERETLMRSLPEFSELSLAELGTLVGLMSEVIINAGDLIVKEGDVVDSIYFIANGTAEVTKEVGQGEQTGSTLLALLSQGESIGLKSAQLFSETGLRSATVTAITPCVLLKINLSDFQQFLKNHRHILSSMNKSVGAVLRMQLIKAAAPFANLPNQRIAWLANLVKEIDVKAQETIFEQGDKAENFYMVAEGIVDLVSYPTENEEHKIAQLGVGQLFGESALQIDGVRNASARAFTDCRLLVLDRDVLAELVAKQPDSPESLLSLVIEGTCPIRKENIIYQQRRTPGGELLTVLKNPANNKYIQLQKEGWFIWQQLNGQLTLQDIARLASKKFEHIEFDTVLDITRRLINEGFAYADALKMTEEIGMQGQQGIAGFFQRFRFQYFLKQADKKIEFLYKHGGKILLSFPVILILFVVMLAGVVFFTMSVTLYTSELLNYNNLVIWFLAVLSASMFFRLLGPLAKGLLIKGYGYAVPHFCIAWQIIGPMAYVDTSHVLLSSRWLRMGIIFCGIYADLVIASLLSCYAFFYQGSALGMFAWLCAFFIYLQTIRSFDPMLDLSGYHLLTTALGAPKLRETAISWLSGGFRQESISLKNKLLSLFFWLYCLGFLLMVLGIVIALENQFILYWPTTTSNLRNIIPSIFIILFIFEILIEMQYQKKITSFHEIK